MAEEEEAVLATDGLVDFTPSPILLSPSSKRDLKQEREVTISGQEKSQVVGMQPVRGGYISQMLMQHTTLASK